MVACLPCSVFKPASSVYQVEQLTLDEDGLVNITAVEVPVDSSGVSIVAKDVLTEGEFPRTGVMAFPTLTPTSREFTPGAWPIKNYNSQSGAEIRILYGISTYQRQAQP
jgi:hypothetical protein